jgi:glycosyltransferase involved in cell wall biosynthesis
MQISIKSCPKNKNFQVCSTKGQRDKGSKKKNPSYNSPLTLCVETAYQVVAREEVLMNPKVSFIIPCYKLAHFLSECVNSILEQTYDNFELLIMDDCSPDNTPEVAAEFKDPRVIYIRNETNLGNIRNYNKGIELSRGSYLWLISADDCLRSRYVLEKFVGILEQNPQVGYVFCPAMTLMEGKDIGVEDWTGWPGKQDRILSGREVVARSTTNCPVCSPTGLVRRECYTNISHFPISLPRVGDYYLWTLFATRYDVGYFSEPMVYYRRHATNMEKMLEHEDPSFYLGQELLVMWLIKKEVEMVGMMSLLPDFCQSLADRYTRRIVYREAMNWEHGYTWDIAIKEITDNASNENEAAEILRLMHSALPTRLASGHTRAGAAYYMNGELEQAAKAFRSAIALKPWSVKPRVYLSASIIEQLFGIRLIPMLKLFKNYLQRATALF